VIEPLRVVVLGNSDALQVASRDLRPDEGPYPILLSRMLAVDGVPADVRNVSRVMGMVEHGVQDWERFAWTHWPHLVVLQYGVQECYPGFFPPRLHRRAWALQRTDRPIDLRLNGFLQAHWSWVQWASNRLDRPWIRGQMSFARFQRQYNRLVDLNLTWSGAVVIAIGMHPPNFRMMKLSGAYPQRRVRMEQAIQAAVSESPRCGYIDFQAVLDGVSDDFQQVMPDGLHLVPEGHRVLAQQIVEKYHEIRSLLDTRRRTVGRLG